MSLSFGTTLLSILFLSPSAASLPTATRRTRSSPVRVRLNRCLADLLGVHTASGVYTSSPYLRTHAFSCVATRAIRTIRAGKWQDSKTISNLVHLDIYREMNYLYEHHKQSISMIFFFILIKKNPLRTYHHSSTKLRINIRFENSCMRVSSNQRYWFWEWSNEKILAPEKSAMQPEPFIPCLFICTPKYNNLMPYCILL